MKDQKTDRYSSQDINVETFISLTVYIRFQDISPRNKKFKMMTLSQFILRYMLMDVQYIRIPRGAFVKLLYSVKKSLNHITDDF